MPRFVSTAMRQGECGWAARKPVRLVKSSGSVRRPKAATARRSARSWAGVVGPVATRASGSAIAVSSAGGDIAAGAVTPRSESAKPSPRDKAKAACRQRRVYILSSLPVARAAPVIFYSRLIIIEGIEGPDKDDYGKFEALPAAAPPLRTTPAGASRLASDAAHDLLDRRVALKHRHQAAVEDRPHAAGDRGLFDRRVVGALEQQAVDRPARHQQLGDRPPAAITGAAAARAADRLIERDRPARGEPVKTEALDQRPGGRRRLLAVGAQPPDQ